MRYLDSSGSLIDGVESRQQAVGRDHQKDRKRDGRNVFAELEPALTGSGESESDRIPLRLIRVEWNFSAATFRRDPLEPVQLILVLSTKNAELRKENNHRWKKLKRLQKYKTQKECKLKMLR